MNMHKPLSPRHLILRLDVSGQPLRWIPWQHAVVLQTKRMVAWYAGENAFTFRGGFSRESRCQSQVTVNSIIAVRGVLRPGSAHSQAPPLSNRELFRRDQYLCLYCGKQLPSAFLTRDHLLPLSRGGTDGWRNVVTACKPCNHAKGARTPNEAGMNLLAVPYIPNRAEYLALSNRLILADQMEFLKKRFRRNRGLQQ